MTDYDTQVLALSPTGYWKCDLASGLTLVDSSGNGNNLVGGAGWVENYRIPGPSALDIPYAVDLTNLNPPTAAGAGLGNFAIGASFSVEVWYGSVGAPPAANIGIVTKGYTAAELRPWWALVIPSGTPLMWFRNVAGTDYKCQGYGNLSDASYSQRGPFHHIVGTYTPGTADLYVDGFHAAQLPVPNTGWGTGGGLLALNNLNGNLGGPWLAAIALYPGQLSAAQVLSNFSLGITGNAFSISQLQGSLSGLVASQIAMTADLAAILAAVRRTL
jgi:hypothetical protein